MADANRGHGIEARRANRRVIAMRMGFGKDEITPTLELLYRNSSEVSRFEILSHISNDLRNQSKKNISQEKQYDGKPMKSPAKETKYGGRFAKDYNWRYRKGFRHLGAEEKKRFKATGKVGGRQLKGTERGTKIRRRIPVTAQSKQLQDTGATIKSIDILSINCNRGAVGPKTGHGKKILSFHEEARRPFGISDAFAEEAQSYAFKQLLKGV